MYTLPAIRKHDASIRIYAELPPAQIAGLRFLAESMDNLAYVSVLNPWRATVRITAPAAQQGRVLIFLESVQKQLGLKNIIAGF